MTWQIERFRGSAADFHARVIPEVPTRQVWVFEVARPAIALGSAQPVAHLDEVACARQGVEIVRRRSGGGAVLLMPDEIVWIDVILPVGDRLWHDDISRAGWWLAEVWAAASEQLTNLSSIEVHRSGMVTTEWSSHVCFAGLGPGEVTAGGEKLIGVSQRRTRAAARFQTAVHRRWDAVGTCGLLSDPRPEPAALAPVAVIDRPIDVIVDAFVEALTHGT